MQTDATWLGILSGIDWTTVLVVLATGLSAAFGPAFMQWRAASNEQKAVRAALLAEVTALASVIRGRDYRGVISKSHLELCRSALGNGFGKGFATCEIPVPELYNLIYRQNIMHLGYLSPQEAADIVHFYQLIQAVVVDVSPGGALCEGTDDDEAFRQAIGLLDSALDIADRLAGKR